MKTVTTNSAREADLFIIRKIIYPLFLALTVGHISTTQIIAFGFESKFPSVSGDVSTARFIVDFYILDKSLCFLYFVAGLTISMSKH